MYISQLEIKREKKILNQEVGNKKSLRERKMAFVNKIETKQIGTEQAQLKI